MTGGAHIVSVIGYSHFLVCDGARFVLFLEGASGTYGIIGGNLMGPRRTHTEPLGRLVFSIMCAIDRIIQHTFLYTQTVILRNDQQGSCYGKLLFCCMLLQQKTSSWDIDADFDKLCLLLRGGATFVCPPFFFLFPFLSFLPFFSSHFLSILSPPRAVLAV